ncbi:MAG: alanyl-tRNA editing protein [Treponema sp.]|jgi:alanyl-tRNA synthetase|nr:alanyl-tRNA editing protein [Treponema sp.]
MNTERLYYDIDDGDIHTATILEIRPFKDKTALILDKTIFYPEGGGQSGDRGAINGVPLLDTREEDGDILHLVSAADGATFKTGVVELTLDTQRRRDFSAQHTAQHLLSGTILRLTGKPTLSMRLGEEVNTIDVDTPELPRETLLQVEEAVFDAIERNCLLITHFCPPENVAEFPLRKVPPQGEGVIRVVEIQGNDFSPCCGTHLRSTGEINMLRILGAEKYKGMTRVSFIAGRRVLNDSRLLRNNADIVSRALKVPVAETAQAALALLDKAGALERRVKALEETLATLKATELLQKAGILAEGATPMPGILALSLPDADFDEALRIGRAAQKLCGVPLVFASPKDSKFAAFCSTKGIDIRPILKPAMEANNGRGGGGPSFFQGMFSSAQALAAFMAALTLPNAPP